MAALRSPYRSARYAKRLMASYPDSTDVLYLSFFGPPPTIISMGTGSLSAHAYGLVCLDPVTESGAVLSVMSDQTGWIEDASDDQIPGYTPRFGYTSWGLLDLENRGFLSFDISGLPIDHITSAILVFPALDYLGTSTVWKLKLDCIRYDANSEDPDVIWAKSVYGGITFTSIGVNPEPPAFASVLEDDVKPAPDLDDLMNADKTRIGFRLIDLSTFAADFLTLPVSKYIELRLTYEGFPLESDTSDQGCYTFGG